MQKPFARLFGTRAPRSSRPVRRCVPHVEALETRAVPAAMKALPLNIPALAPTLPGPTQNQGPTVDSISVASDGKLTFTGHATPGATITLTYQRVNVATGAFIDKSPVTAATADGTTPKADSVTGVWTITLKQGTFGAGDTYNVTVNDATSGLTTDWAVSVYPNGMNVGFESTAGYGVNGPGRSGPSGVYTVLAAQTTKPGTVKLPIADTVTLRSFPLQVGDNPGDFPTDWSRIDDFWALGNPIGSL